MLLYLIGKAPHFIAICLHYKLEIYNLTLLCSAYYDNFRLYDNVKIVMFRTVFATAMTYEIYYR